MTENTTTEGGNWLIMYGRIAENFDLIGDTLALFTQEPAIYFVAMALIGSGAGVARRFVPMKKR